MIGWWSKISKYFMHIFKLIGNILKIDKQICIFILKIYNIYFKVFSDSFFFSEVALKKSQNKANQCSSLEAKATDYSVQKFINIFLNTQLQECQEL